MKTLDERFEGLEEAHLHLADLARLLTALDKERGKELAEKVLILIQENREDADPVCGWPAILKDWIERLTGEQT